MKKRYLLLIPVLIVLTVWIWWGNSALMVEEIVVADEEIPASFSGFRIAQVSDLHNTEFGENNGKLLKLLAGTKPDIIVITGDLVDARRMNFPLALEFVEKAVRIAPCYYVPGNHEGRTLNYPALERDLLARGVRVLRNEKLSLTRNGEFITLMGVDDPGLDLFQKLGPYEEIYQKRLKVLSEAREGYTILLSHRPEDFDRYVAGEFDLVFSGHAHGGQMRLPLLGGVLAPGQGLFPEYDSGLYTRGDTSMVVSRGLGNSAFPFRINNRPEIILVVLKSA